MGHDERLQRQTDAFAETVSKQHNSTTETQTVCLNSTITTLLTTACRAQGLRTLGAWKAGFTSRLAGMTSMLAAPPTEGSSLRLRAPGLPGMLQPQQSHGCSMD
jgi:hypothetical protein